MIKEPQRLIKGSGELAQSLAATQLKLPSEERLARLAARLAANGAMVGEGAAALLVPEPRPRVAPGKPPLELSMKLVISGVVLGVLALGGALAVRHGSAPATAAVRPTVNAPAPQLAQAPLPAPAAAPARAPLASNTAAPAPARAESEPSVAPSSPTAGVHEPSAGRESTVGAAARAASEGSDSVAKRSQARAAEAAPKRAALKAPAQFEGSAVAASSPSLPENTVVDSEVEMLKKARNALGSDSLEAFALSERCRAQYPNGAFTQEREFIAISALVRLGRRDEARSRASLFRTHYRNSAYLPQLTRMLGEE